MQKPLKWRKALTAKLQKAQEGISLPVLNLHQGRQASEETQSASLLSGDSNSAELQEKQSATNLGEVSETKG